MPRQYPTKVPVICRRCGTQFLVRPSLKDTAHYCSLACKNGPRIARTCPTCGAAFTIPPSHANAGHARFCSTACRESALPTLNERFWAKVDRAGDCWNWTASQDRDGYGHVSVNGTLRSAHRVAWELTYGPIPDGMAVCHRCDCTSCVRPEHLFLGTHADNMRDMQRKGRHPNPRGVDHWTRRDPERVPRGEAHGMAKLTSDDVRQIRALYAAGGISQDRLAEQFHVHRKGISQIIRRIIWKHVE